MPIQGPPPEAKVAAHRGDADDVNAVHVAQLGAATEDRRHHLEADADLARGRSGRGASRRRLAARAQGGERLRRWRTPPRSFRRLAPTFRSEEDAIAFGDAVCEVVQRETRDDGAVVHLSLAGGRKTMSFHGGAAMTLFGRPQDELSHVLVHPPALERPEADFWWPGHNHTGDVNLSLIPFVRVRGRLPRTMLEQKMDYARYVAQVNAATEGTSVVLEMLADTSTLRIAGGTVLVRLEPKDFIVYRVLAEWAKTGVLGAGPNGVGPEHRGWITVDMLRRPQAYRPSPVGRVIELGGTRSTYTLAGRDKTANSAFRQAVSRVRRAIAGAVAEQVLANRLLAEPSGGRSDDNPSRFGLLLSPHEIAIRASEEGPEIAPFAFAAHPADTE